MDLHEQTYFITIAELGSLSRAARQLNVSQPALSQYLTRLEQQLGTVLIQRSRTSDMILTEAGKEYLDCCRAVLSDWKRTESHILAIRENRAQQVTVGLSSSHGIIQFFHSVAAVREKYPTFQVKLEEWPASLWPEKLVRGEVQLVFSSYAEENPQICYRNYSQHQAILGVHKDNPLARYSCVIPGQENLAIPIREVGETPLVLMNPNTVFGAQEREWMARSNFIPVVAAYVSHLDFMVSMVQECKMACIMNNSERRLKEHPDVLPVKLEDPFVYRSGVMYRKDMFLTPAMEELIGQYMKWAENRNRI